MIRILKIVPGRGESRQERLLAVESWMAAQEWRLADFAEGAGSAVFERNETAAALPWMDGTRWLPGPDALKPREWLRTARADLRWVILPGAFAFAVLVTLLAVLTPPSFLPENAAKLEEEARWRFVIARQLNIREAPNRRAQVIGVLYRNQRVMIEGDVNADWTKVALPSRGYVAKRYLSRTQQAKPGPSPTTVRPARKSTALKSPPATRPGAGVSTSVAKSPTPEPPKEARERAGRPSPLPPPPGIPALSTEASQLPTLQPPPLPPSPAPSPPPVEPLRPLNSPQPPPPPPSPAPPSTGG